MACMHRNVADTFLSGVKKGEERGGRGRIQKKEKKFAENEDRVSTMLILLIRSYTGVLVVMPPMNSMLKVLNSVRGRGRWKRSSGRIKEVSERVNLVRRVLEAGNSSHLDYTYLTISYLRTKMKGEKEANKWIRRKRGGRGQ